MNRILVINVNWLGDVVFSTPVFKALKRAYPKATISCLAPSRVEGALECCPFIDEVITFDEKGKDESFFAKLSLIYRLRAKKFDAAFLLHRSLTRALIVFLAGIPVRVGYDTKGRGFLLTHRAKALPEGTHRRDHYLGVVESFGVEVHDRTCELAADEKSLKTIEALLRKNSITPSDFLVVVNAGGNWDLKRWPKENFSLLIARLAQMGNVEIVLPGSGKDRALAEEIAVKSRFRPVILCGETNLKELIALMKRANLVIAADTGPLHVASAMGTPTIGLFGPTRPEVTGPRGKGKTVTLQNDVGCNRLPCYYLECPNNVCMKTITVEEIVAVVREVVVKNLKF